MRVNVPPTLAFLFFFVSNFSTIRIIEGGVFALGRTGWNKGIEEQREKRLQALRYAVGRVMIVKDENYTDDNDNDCDDDCIP